MTFISKMSALFPSARWTGGSAIHASVAGVVSIPVKFKNRSLILLVLEQAKIGARIYKNLTKVFGKMEWLTDQQTFEKLFLVDVNLSLQGLQTSESRGRIRNPVTGNLFHRIALMPPYIGGVRFWTLQDLWGNAIIGYRFRLVEQMGEEEQENVREESRRRSSEVDLEVQSVYDCILEVSEPQKVQVPKLVTNISYDMEMM